MDQKAGGSAPSTPKKLDTMPQEDLVKYSKKQMMLLQKLKAKCDELQKKLKEQTDYEETKQKCIEFEKMIAEHGREKEENSRSQNQLKKEKNAIVEEFDCFKMKQETLLVTLQCLQDDYDKMASENEQLKGKMEDFEAKQDYLDQIDDQSQQLTALKEHIKNMKASHEQIEETNKILLKENKDAKAEVSASKISLDLFKSKASGSDNAHKITQEKLMKYEAELKVIQAENKAMEKEIKRLRDIETKFQNMSEDFETIKSEKLSSDNVLKDIELKLDAKVIELEVLQKQNHDDRKDWEIRISEIENAKKLELEEMTSNLDQANREISNMKMENDTKGESLNEELNTLKEKLVKFEIENGELAKKNNDLFTSVSDANQNSQNEKVKLDQLTAILIQKDSEMTALENKLDIQMKEYENVVLISDERLDEITLIQSQIEERSRNFEQINEKKICENNDLKSQLSCLENEIEKLKENDNEDLNLKLTAHFEIVKKEKMDIENLAAELQIKLDSKYVEIEELTMQKQEISHKYEDEILKTENFKLSTSGELADAREQLDHAQQEILDLKNKLSADDATLNNEIVFLREMRCKFEKENSELAEKNQQNENMLKENSVLLEEEKKKTAERITKQKEKESDLFSLENKFSAREKEFENLAEKYQEFQNRFSTSQQELKEKEKEVQETKECAANELAQLRDEMETVLQNSNDQQATIETLNAEVEKLSQKVAENKKRSTELSLDNEKLSKDVLSAAELSESLQSEISALKSSEKYLKVKIEEKVIENQAIVDGISKKEQLLQSAEKTQQSQENQQLIASLQSLRVSKLELENEFSKLKQKCKGLEETLQELHEKDEIVSELKKQHDDVTAENKSFRQKIEGLGIVTDDLHQKLSELSMVEEKYINAESKISTLEAELLNKTESLENICGKLDEAILSGEKLKNESADQIKEIEDRKNEISRMTESKKSEIENLEEKMSGLIATNSELKEVLKNSECEKKDLCDRVEGLQIKLDAFSVQQREATDLKAALDLKLSEMDKRLVESNEALKLQQNNEKSSSETVQSNSLLKTQLSELHLKLENLTTERGNNETENAQLKEDLAIVQSEVQAQLDRNSKLSEHLAILEKEKNTSEEIIANLKSNFSTVQESLEAQNDELSSKLEKMEKKWVELEKTSTAERVEGSGDTKQIDQLQKSIKEKDVYSTKLKMVAVKAKKELDATKSQLLSQVDENNKLVAKMRSLESQLMGSQTQASNVQMMQIECDKLQDQLDQIFKEKSALNKNIEELFNQLSNTQTEKADLKAKLDLVESDLEKSVADNIESEKKLTLSKSNYLVLDSEKEGVVKQKNQLIKEIDALKIQVSNLVRSLDENEKKYEDSQQSLSHANKNLKNNDLLSLEITEYEKTIQDLHLSMSEVKSSKQADQEKVTQLETEIGVLQNERSSLEQLRQEAETRVTRTKEMLDGARDDIERLSSIEMKLNGELKDTQQQSEVLQQDCEQLKLDLSQKISECRLAEEQINQLKNSHDLNLDILERKLKSTQADLLSYKSEKERLSADYESYKIRVHSVLKQQKSKEAKNQTPELNTELVGFRQKVDQLQLKLLETQNTLTSRDGELDLLQGDYDRLLRQQQQSSESATEREGRWKSRVKSLQQELVALRKQHSELQKKMTGLNEVCISIDEVAALKRDHETFIESLNGQLAKRENEIFRLKTELKDLSEERKVSLASTPKKPTLSVAPPIRNTDHYLTSSITGLDFRGVDREEGEGEENPDQPPPLSFEEILQSPTEIKSVKLLSESQSMTSEVNLKQLESRYEAQSKQLEHLTEVARENEATSARLIDQNKVLKNEIRRLEKNQERENSVSNMEYLKNVIYKFVTLPPCDEKRHLLPVIDTMLKFNDAERMSLQHLAIGDDGSVDQDIEGWGSYLQRWSGM